MWEGLTTERGERWEILVAGEMRGQERPGDVKGGIREKRRIKGERWWRKHGSRTEKKSRARETTGGQGVTEERNGDERRTDEAKGKKKEGERGREGAWDSIEVKRQVKIRGMKRGNMEILEAKSFRAVRKKGWEDAAKEIWKMKDRKGWIEEKGYKREREKVTEELTKG